MAQGNVYSASNGTEFSISAAREVIRLNGATTAQAIILSVEFGQTGDYGDTAAEGLRVTWSRATTLGAGGTNCENIEGHMPSAPAAKCVAVYNSAVSTGLSQFGATGMNVQAGFEKIWTPEAQIVVPSVATEAVIFAVEAPIDGLDFNCTITWEEILL